MKKILSGLVLVSLLVMPVIVLAGPAGGTGAIAPKQAPDDIDIMQLLKRITDWLFSILLIVAAIFIIIAAYYFVTAMGDPEKVKSARQFVLYALIGVLVGVAAKGLVYLVQQIAGTV